MQTLTFEQLPQGGFAGLIERRFVTDSRLFGWKKHASTAEGIGNFVYLADANFLPNGETGLHPHREVDVISVMVSGRIAHAGSLEHGQEISAGAVQVQRAGGEGFTHNEINPDDSENHMIQLWVLPDEAGECAGYKVYEPGTSERMRIYGGPKDQQDTFYSHTAIDVANVPAGESVSHSGEAMMYITTGGGTVNGESIEARTLIRSDGVEFVADDNTQLILIYENGDD